MDRNIRNISVETRHPWPDNNKYNYKLISEWPSGTFYKDTDREIHFPKLKKDTMPSVLRALELAIYKTIESWKIVQDPTNLEEDPVSIAVFEDKWNAFPSTVNAGNVIYRSSDRYAEWNIGTVPPFPNAWIQYEFNQETTILNYSTACHRVTGRGPRGWNLYGTNDPEEASKEDPDYNNWNLLHQVTNQGWNFEAPGGGFYTWRERHYPSSNDPTYNTIPCKYYRILWTAKQGSTNYIKVNNISLYGPRLRWVNRYPSSDIMKATYRNLLREVYPEVTETLNQSLPLQEALLQSICATIEYILKEVTGGDTGRYHGQYQDNEEYLIQIIDDKSVENILEFYDIIRDIDGIEFEGNTEHRIKTGLAASFAAVIKDAFTGGLGSYYIL